MFSKFYSESMCMERYVYITGIPALSYFFCCKSDIAEKIK